MAAVDWVVVSDNNFRKIGAIGFIEGRTAIIASFYDYRDGNMDGKVSLGERVAAMAFPLDISKKAVTEVAMAARGDLDVIAKDGNFGNVAMNLFMNFASGLITDAIYTVYMSRSVGKLASGVAGLATDNLIKQFVIRKGMEAAVKEAFKTVTR